MNTVAIIGLGQMGTTLAKLSLQHGDMVHVWNRTAGKTEVLEQAGAVAHGSAAAAIGIAEVVVVCVHDYAAFDSIFSDEQTRAAVAGKLVIHLTTGSPQEAREALAWAQASGASYIDGAIQVAPEQMGKPDTTILISGARADYDRGRAVMAAYGGNLAYLGDSIAAAATMDLATLSYVYGAILGFFQGALLIEKEGLSLNDYGAIVEAIGPSYGAFLKHEAGVIQSGDFRITQSPLSISVDATRRIEQITRSLGVNAELPAIGARLLEQAARAGYGNEELAAVIKVLRGAAPAGAELQAA